MKRTHTNLFAAGLTASILLAASSAPALSQCVKKHPLFGVDVYMADKRCPKKVKKSRPAKKKSTRMASHEKAAKPDPVVRKVQTLLTGLGYKLGAADGIKGPATSAALTQFQTNMGLPASTSMGDTLVLLHRASGQ